MNTSEPTKSADTVIKSAVNVRRAAARRSSIRTELSILSPLLGELF
jgi:hypothetical protein